MARVTAEPSKDFNENLTAACLGLYRLLSRVVICAQSSLIVSSTRLRGGGGVAWMRNSSATVKFQQRKVGADNLETPMP